MVDRNDWMPGLQAISWTDALIEQAYEGEYSEIIGVINSSYGFYVC